VEAALRMLERNIGRVERLAHVLRVLEHLELDAAIGVLESDIALVETGARRSGRDAVRIEMPDPPFERPLRDRIGAGGELVRSLAPFLPGAAGREGRHDRAGRAGLVGEVQVIDRDAAVIETMSV